MVARYLTIRDLPETLAIFPLTGALLLPQGTLPLNVFEPRYLAMIDDTMRGTRMIGMIQTRVPENSTARPPLYDVGCAGRITSYNETGDGRLHITLTGICRFRVGTEIPVKTPYRQIHPDHSVFAHDLASEATEEIDVARAPLLKSLKPYLEAQQLRADWNSVERAPTAQLVNALATICPFGTTEKQALLEADTLLDRARTLTALLEMANADSPTGPEGAVQ